MKVKSKHASPPAPGVAPVGGNYRTLLRDIRQSVLVITDRPLKQDQTDVFITLDHDDPNLLFGVTKRSPAEVVCIFTVGNRHADIGLQNALSRILSITEGDACMQDWWDQAYRGWALAVRGPAAQLQDLFARQRSLRLRVSASGLSRTKSR